MPTHDEAWQRHEQNVHNGAATPTSRADFDAGWEAAMDFIGNNEHRHVVNVTETGWTLQHPVEERAQGSLFDCPLNLLVSTAAEEGHLSTGRFFIWRDESGALLWEEVA